MDVNGDAKVSALDALGVINHLARSRVGEGQSSTDWQRFDVNGDGAVSALDALVVIKRLNRQAAPDQAPQVWSLPPADVDEVLTDLGTDDEDVWYV